MRTTRHLRDFLAAEFPDWNVTDDNREVTVTRPTIAMAPATITRQPLAGQQLAVTVEIEVWLLTEKTAPREVENTLDSNVFKLLSAVEADPRFTWTTARRAALETGQGWNLTITQAFQTTPL